MRFATIASLFLSALSISAEITETDATAANELLVELTKLPTCATTCVTTSLPISPCAPDDFACLCSDETYIASSESCILANCTVKGALLAQRWQKKACQAPVRNAGPLTSRIGIALVVIAAVCVFGRFLARWRIQGSSIGWDDWTILASLILLIPSTAILQYMAHNGMGRDIWTVPFENITLMFKYFWIEQYIYQVLIVITKISIILTYLRIFPKEISPRFTYLSWIIIGILILYGLAFCISFAFQCRPISYFWTQWDGESEGHCDNFRLVNYIGSGMNIFFDLLVFFLPVPKLMQLQVRDTQRKVGIILTFLIGLFVTLCSILRLQFLASIGKYTNATYHYNDIGLWSALEGDVGVICACMPSIMGPILYLFRNTIGFRLSSATKSGSHSRIVGDKSAARLHSRASDRGELELEYRVQNNGGIEKTTVTSMYNMPHEQSSGDDVELIYQNNRREWRSQRAV